ncbi:hypothetical protein PQ465_19210 [Sphingobacterium oryzagri]|uniref:Uncharacterized protein n=1 Tax=Sphingobacterium oryzagri TaxID=3025669 RepID=A0ABY7WJE2_9SPHI|nr:hypothetical protein [Sphingobacterium sp. KACC 22765]WDF68410.1 hypothetical protein PQ465_19210 [Sphingobacterium sp. KACC 22765]
MTDRTCTTERNMELLQQHEDAGTTFTLYKVDNGSSGFTVSLRICNVTQNKLIEEISLRGEDYFPTIDSVVDHTVYLHYNFPRTNPQTKTDELPFDSVVLGDALLDKTTLTYQYIVKNITNE